MWIALLRGSYTAGLGGSGGRHCVPSAGGHDSARHAARRGLARPSPADCVLPGRNPRCSRNPPANPNPFDYQGKCRWGVVGRSKRMTHERQTSYRTTPGISVPVPPLPLDPNEPPPAGVFASRTRRKPIAGRSADHTQPKNTHTSDNLRLLLAFLLLHHCCCLLFRCASRGCSW